MLHKGFRRQEIVFEKLSYSLDPANPKNQKGSVVQQSTNRESMTTSQTITAPTNTITQQGHVALIALAADLGAELEVLTNEETGEEIGSIVRYDTRGNDEWSVSVMPDPYCPLGTGWVAVMDGESVVAGPTVPGVVQRYRDWLGTQD